MQLEEFAKAMVEEPSTVWECPSCGLITTADENLSTGFAELIFLISLFWTGVIICPDCKSSMKQEEVTNERNKSRHPRLAPIGGSRG